MRRALSQSLYTSSMQHLLRTTFIASRRGRRSCIAFACAGGVHLEAIPRECRGLYLVSISGHFAVNVARAWRHEPTMLPRFATFSLFYPSAAAAPWRSLHLYLHQRLSTTKKIESLNITPWRCHSPSEPALHDLLVLPLHQSSRGQTLWVAPAPLAPNCSQSCGMARRHFKLQDGGSVIGCSFVVLSRVEA